MVLTHSCLTHMSGSAVYKIKLTQSMHPMKSSARIQGESPVTTISKLKLCIRLSKHLIAIPEACNQSQMSCKEWSTESFTIFQYTYHVLETDNLVRLLLAIHLCCWQVHAISKSHSKKKIDKKQSRLSRTRLLLAIHLSSWQVNAISKSTF